MRLFRIPMTLMGSLLLAGQFAILQDMMAATVTLMPTADACLFELDPENNLGASTHLAAGTIRTGQRSRALYRFDLGQVPANAIIQSVTLTLRVVITPPGGPSSTFGLHRLLKSWSEGVHSGRRGGLAGASEVTWNSRVHPASQWSSPGAAAGSDYTAAASGSVFIAGNATYPFISSSGLVSDVQAWASNPVTNFGWILVCQAEGINQTARRFAAREDAANAPTLVVQYSVPAAAVAISGHVTYYNGVQTVPGVTVGLTGDKTEIAATDVGGAFSFSVSQSGSFAVSPSKLAETPPDQGVTTQDIALIRSHILGVGPLDSSLKLLAADVNASGSVTTLDIALIRRVILRSADSYPGGLWKFVRSDFTFANPSAPWIFDRSRSISNPTSNQPNLDFIGIKLGDVNATWTPP